MRCQSIQTRSKCLALIPTLSLCSPLIYTSMYIQQIVFVSHQLSSPGVLQGPYRQQSCSCRCKCDGIGSNTGNAQGSAEQKRTTKISEVETAKKTRRGKSESCIIIILIILLLASCRSSCRRIDVIIDGQSQRQVIIIPPKTKCKKTPVG